MLRTFSSCCRRSAALVVRRFASPFSSTARGATGPRYQDRVVVVTGGSKGIGEGIVRVFCNAGSRVVFCARGEESGKNLESELNRASHQVMFVRCDMTKHGDIENLINTTVKQFGRLDCLVNNAGWHPPVTRIEDVSVDDFQYLLNFNLTSYFVACKTALPHLRKTQGNIINISSLVATIGQLGSVAYVATKGAIISMTKALAVDEAKYGVRVNSVSPGNVMTPLWNEFAQSADDVQAAIKEGEDAQLLGRMGTLEESGQVCLFLAAEATFTTGIDFLLSGGAELNYGKKTRLDDS
ncbi:17-beta-hydroxysteroid dehydrogenase 14-like [Corticium candelabrum]|uniref:17-beta-hydroxysteroid dehydrogenase 14-like n=1 Tax=Corticium candelabrum TaxID=121492 RepID=UPI002E25FCD0|nr:17-beta-hydroxysteroid dehydrogenase 14-like [Corticium candelabrum]